MVPQLVVRSKKATHASQRRQPLFCGLILLPLTADTLQEHPTAWVCAEVTPSVPVHPLMFRNYFGSG
ncbi:hypothetical protein F5144DRAFT_215141 [Chaetomium tenue]|uniref:Uncharacterized protein n=1 Tax=Chaetomium tenue TaxID=1854479 RepID=A0ACB7P5N8_9PEZI|nr:hypothetical protein F5144DRAFT_215141 [Chaetomium globosum]